MKRVRYSMLFSSLLGILAFGSVSTSVFAASDFDSLGVPDVLQSRSNWCWAASSVSVLRYFEIGVSQNEVVESVMKTYKLILPVIALALCFGAVSFADSESGKEKALRDYKRSQEAKTKQLSAKERNVVSDLKLSDFSIDMFYIKSVDVITSYNGSKISEILEPSDEKLSFMMNGDDPEGIIIATENEPVLMGSINKSKKLIQNFTDTQERKERRSSYPVL